jgi:hypothetical protein
MKGHCSVATRESVRGWSLVETKAARKGCYSAAMTELRMVRMMVAERAAMMVYWKA